MMRIQTGALESTIHWAWWDEAAEEVRLREDPTDGSLWLLQLVDGTAFRQQVEITYMNDERLEIHPMTLDALRHWSGAEIRRKRIRKRDKADSWSKAGC